MKIYAPVTDFNGFRNNVRFVNGVGETDDPRLIEWFRSRGYKVPIEESKPVDLFNLVIDAQNDQIEVEDDEDEMMGYAERTPNFDDMNPNELRDWAKANGKGHLIKNTRNKEKLIEILRG